MANIYIIELYQTNVVANSLEEAPFEDLDIINQAGGRICFDAVCDLDNGLLLERTYSRRFEDVTVIALVQVSQSTVRVTIIRYKFDGDDGWDPGGGEGMPDPNRRNRRQIATAHAVRLGRNLSFHQASGWPIPLFDDSIVYDYGLSEPINRLSKSIRIISIIYSGNLLFSTFDTPLKTSHPPGHLMPRVQFSNSSEFHLDLPSITAGKPKPYLVTSTNSSYRRKVVRYKCDDLLSKTEGLSVPRPKAFSTMPLPCPLLPDAHPVLSKTTFPTHLAAEGKSNFSESRHSFN